MSHELPAVIEQSRLSITALPLTSQVRATLTRNGIRIIADLQAVSAGELLLLYKVGLQSLRSVRSALAERGTCLRDDEEHIAKAA